MANTAQTKKRARQNDTQRVHNASYGLRSYQLVQTCSLYLLNGSFPSYLKKRLLQCRSQRRFGQFVPENWIEKLRNSLPNDRCTGKSFFIFSFDYTYQS